MINKADAFLLRQSLDEQRFNELEKMIHLLEFAAAVLIHFAVLGQDVQFFQQFNRLIGTDFIGEGFVWLDFWHGCTECGAKKNTKKEE